MHYKALTDNWHYEALMDNLHYKALRSVSPLSARGSCRHHHKKDPKPKTKRVPKERQKTWRKWIR